MGGEAVGDDIFHEIYPGGDTLFLCGPRKVKLLVHSIFLTNVSKVFRAMFGPNFREGQLQTNSGPREIPLPEDDPFAMQIICNVAHSRSVPDTMPSAHLIAIACAADKYDAIAHLHFASSRWCSLAIERIQRTFRLKDACNMMVAAYVLKDSQTFRKTTEEIIFQYNQSFRGIESFLGDIMPPDIILTLEENRTRLRLHLMTLLLNLPCYETLSDDECGCEVRRCAAWMKMIGNLPLLPCDIAELSLAKTIVKIEGMGEREELEGMLNADTIDGRASTIIGEGS